MQPYHQQNRVLPVDAELSHHIIEYVQRITNTNRQQKHKVLKKERVQKQASPDYCSKNSLLKR